MKTKLLLWVLISISVAIDFGLFGVTTVVAKKKHGHKHHGCIDPVGICYDTALDEDCIYAIEDLQNVPVGGLFFQAIVTINRDFGNHDDLYETAIQFRQTVFNTFKRWNTVAAFEEDALDYFGRQTVSNKRRRCQPAADDAAAQELFTYQRSVTTAYTYYFIYLFEKPTRLQNFVDDRFLPWGLDPYICDDGVSCDNVNTPWGLAYTLALESEDLKSRDGWNELGDYDRDFNMIPWSDFRGDDTRYIPVNDFNELKDITRWQPLLESDEYGFLYFQGHSVPHIGYTGISYFYTNEEFCDASNAPDPEYDYDVEMQLALDRLAQLTELQKVEIEYFDNKINLFPFVSQLFFRRGFNLDSFEYTIANTITVATLYEAGLRVWKSKVDYDRVRPTSIVQELLGDELITSYGGTTADGETRGTQTFYGRDWEPYIRTMPHAEYPSGSACTCEAWAEAMRTLFGTDDITSIINGPVTANIAAFSSKNEPLSTPSSDITLSYSSFSEISQRCGESRLEGGMHFTASVPNGQDLCRDIGRRVTESIVALSAGQQPEFVIDFDTAMWEERQCYPDSSDSDESDSNESDD